MAAKNKRKLAKLDLSRYETAERLPANIISIIKNAICVYEGNTSKVAKLYNLSKETVDLIFEEHYLQLTQIIDSQTKSKELDTGINNAILLLSDHINSLQENKQTNLMLKSTINDVTKITDRFLNLKQQFNNTYDVMINKMNEQTFKVRQLEILENGKLEDFSDYNKNVETVFSKLRSTTSRKIKATNVNTKEVKHYASITEAAIDLQCNGDSIRKRLADKLLHRNEWAFEEE